MYHNLIIDTVVNILTNNMMDLQNSTGLHEKNTQQLGQEMLVLVALSNNEGSCESNLQEPSLLGCTKYGYR